MSMMEHAGNNKEFRGPDVPIPAHGFGVFDAPFKDPGEITSPAYAVPHEPGEPGLDGDYASETPAAAEPLPAPGLERLFVPVAPIAVPRYLIRVDSSCNEQDYMRAEEDWIRGQIGRVTEHAEMPTDEEWERLIGMQDALQSVARKLGVHADSRRLARGAHHMYDDQAEMINEHKRLTGKSLKALGMYDSAYGLFLFRHGDGDTVRRDSVHAHELAHSITVQPSRLASFVDVEGVRRLHIHVEGLGVMRSGERGNNTGDAFNEGLTDYWASRLFEATNRNQIMLSYMPFDFVVQSAFHETGRQRGVPAEVVGNQWMRDSLTGEEVALRAMRQAMGRERADALMALKGYQNVDQSLAVAEALELYDAKRRLESEDMAVTHPFGW